MPIGSRRKRGQDEYVFIDGVAMRAEEAVRINLTEEDTAAVPGQAEAAAVPGAAEAAGGKGRKRKWNAQKAFSELESGDAFELSDDFELSMQQVVNLRADDKRKMRRVYLVLGLILLVIFVANLCLSRDYIGVFYDPLTVIQALGERIYLNVGKWTGASWWYDLAEVDANQAIPGYADIGGRFDVTFVTLVCGFLLSLSGMMYQNVFKNPIAAPSMLGVSAGVRIGTIVLVVIYGTAAVDMAGMRYVFCYIGGVVIILLVILFSKLLAGKHRSINVADMLIVGSVLSQMLATVSMYFLTYIMDDDMYDVFYELTSGARADVAWYVYILMIVIILIAVVPVFLARFRMNAVAFDDGDVRLLGVDPEKLRVFVLIMGTIMILAAQIHVGVITMVALVVPFLTRYVVGSEFGKQMIGNMLLGPALLLLCRFICGLIPFVGAGLSLEMVVGFVALPLYVWMVALGKRGWE